MKENFLKKLSGLFFVMMLIFSVGALGFGTKAHAVDKPTSGTLTIHKLKFDGIDPSLIPPIAGDGTQLGQLPPGALPAPGVKFAIVSTTGSNLSMSPSQKDALNYYNSVIGNANVPQDTGTTGADGTYTTKTLPAGQYVVVELMPETGTYSMSAPVVVSIPMMNLDGTGWNSNVHIYTKDGVTLGAAKMQKLDPSNNPLQGATFSLYMQGTSGNPDTLVANNLTTGSDGYTDVVGNLLVGNYYFVETSTLDTYLLNGKQVPFTVADTDMAYDSNGQLLQNKVKTVSLVNYMKPTLQKTRTTDESVDIGETVTWKISTDVPLNLTDYTKYVITDTLDTRLTYVGNMSVTLDNAPLNPNLYNVQVNGRVITVTFTDIFAQGNIGAIQSGDKFNIQFDTTVNNTAIPGVQIPNNAVLTMNNGWVDATSTEANPPMVETGGRQFMKVDPNNNPLQGAQFVVSKTNPDNSISYMKQSANLNVTWVNSKSDATVFTSANDGTFQMYGLAYGTYNIEEVKAPGGYNLLNGIQTFTVDPNSYDDDAMILVVNTMAPTIPITGGIGTIIFFAIGLVLMGIVYFFYRRYESQSA